MLQLRAVFVFECVIEFKDSDLRFSKSLQKKHIFSMADVDFVRGDRNIKNGTQSERDPFCTKCVPIILSQTFFSSP